MSPNCQKYESIPKQFILAGSLQMIIIHLKKKLFFEYTGKIDTLENLLI